MAGPPFETPSRRLTEARAALRPPQPDGEGWAFATAFMACRAGLAGVGPEGFGDAAADAHTGVIREFVQADRVPGGAGRSALVRRARGLGPDDRRVFGEAVSGLAGWLDRQ